ncbi:MAG: MBL fold metallo-hydrolase [SAR202 cluster bacterium]|nr:MBL fold metallo-hydrolase [SAR202 cluster bacterium]MQG35207.1 MBL fold metallo-hydrolase [SAR202 cluster bacterium]MQG86034.1 MBL fold metallo-hydrolase [SAR202 cluster bacterium]|tara:strand:+ start:7080 stop:7913 length:834 start_codon:yes stop_codon:yes gene_type:complete
MLSTEVKILSDGNMKMDGGSMFGSMPKLSWENTVPTDRKNRITLGLNCLLLQIGGKNILVDTGIGPKDHEKNKEALGLVPSRLLKGLRNLGIRPKDINKVVLTDLQFDHSGGCTRMDRAGNLVATFPKAEYYVQRKCWDSASNLNERNMDKHDVDDYQPLFEKGQLEMLDGDSEIMPGLQVIRTDGCADGHQVVLFNHGGERIVFLGDLIPTHHHLNLGVISAFDYAPEKTLEQKRFILEEAEKQGWLLVFAHGHDTKAGYLEKRNSTTYLRPIEFE